MNILVAGDRGYIGTVMVEFLSKLGHSVTGLDTEYYFDGDFTSPPNHYPRIKKDIRDVSEDDLASFDAVVHLAALSNDPVGNLREEWTCEINYEASVRLAQLAKRAGVRRFLHASSCSMYGAAGDEMLTEEAPFHPVTPYAVSKVRTEEAISFLADIDFSPTFLRNATVYGVSPRLRVDLVLNNLVGWAVTVGKIRILSDGTPWRPLVHVEDVAQAFGLVLTASLDRVRNQAFNVGSNTQNYQVRDLAAIVQKVATNCAIEYSGEATPDPRNYQVSFAKLERTFPLFKPRWDAFGGALQIYNAYRDNGLTLEGFQGRKYVRLKQLQHLLDTGQLDKSLRWKAPSQP